MSADSDQDAYAPPSAPSRVSRDAETSEYSGFTRGWIITDLVFACIRVPLGLLAILGMTLLPDGSPLHAAALAVVATTVGIAVFGILGNTLLLLRKPAGVTFGFVDLTFSALGIAAGLWDGILRLGEPAEAAESARRHGMEVGLVLAVIVRVALNVCYAIALNQAAKTLAAASRTGPSPSQE
jgi:hypothetical protein